MKFIISVLAILFFCFVFAANSNAQTNKPQDKPLKIKSKPQVMVRDCRQDSGLTRLKVTFDKSAKVAAPFSDTCSCPLTPNPTLDFPAAGDDNVPNDPSTDHGPVPLVAKDAAVTTPLTVRLPAVLSNNNPVSPLNIPPSLNCTCVVKPPGVVVPPAAGTDHVASSLK